MKKIFISLLMAMTALTAANGNANAAGINNAEDKVLVQFRENTIVVKANGLTGATLYTQSGKLIEESNGKTVQFEVEQGNYLLCARIKGETIARWVVVK